MKMLIRTIVLASLLSLCAGTPLFAQTHTLQVRKTGDGSGMVRDCHSAAECLGEQIACGTQCLAVFLDGESVLLKAIPDDGSVFGGWLVNGEPPVSQDIQMTQDVTVIVTFATQADTQPPVVTLNVDRDTLRPGETVAITTTAADNVGVTEFHLTVNGEEIAAAPGSTTYAPTAAGVYAIIAEARDAAGNRGTASRQLSVRGETMTVSLFEGVDMERGVSHRDLNTVTLMPGEMNAVRTIVLPQHVELFAFAPEADLYFSYRDRAIIIVPTTSAAIAVLQHTPYESVTIASLDSAAFSSDAAGRVVTPADTVLINTAEGGYAKLGHLQTNAEEWTLQFSYAMLTP